eukprot:c16049_g1_i1.p1 GENE.c16049_g1_i1~~c16049_g1_i1.p1  ORF type:complete len:463 (+),score=103.32 c16049_g1_i1:87-1475(+)
MLINFFFLVQLFISYKFVITSKLEIFNSLNESTSIHEFITPAFELGNISFPFSAPVLIGVGRYSINEFTDSQIQEKLINSSSSKLIVFVDYINEIFVTEFIFQCQEKDWCGGVLLRDYVYYPTGRRVWSLFDSHRSSSEYKIPLVEASASDYTKILNLLSEVEKNNQTYKFTLTYDQNPWKEMFHSVAMLVVFQIFIGLWSFCCIILSIRLLWEQHNQKVKESKQSQVTLKQVCLVFHLISNIFRFVLCIDPLQCNQLFVYPILIFLLAGSIGFETASSILLSFVVRELTQAITTVNVMKNVKVAYCLIVVFIFITFLVSALEGFKLVILPVPTFAILAIFYAISNFVCGVWYFLQGYKFLKRFQKSEKATHRQNTRRVALTRIALLNSIGMIMYTFLFLLAGVRQTSTNPWGFFLSGVLLNIILLIISLFEIMIFGGLDLKRIQQSFKILTFREESNSLSL